ncbi:MAG TPA: radical SAM family heme chaperone HemW [Terriglobales bacterium]|nr:radical SAM family heme chaperone HemW [Terriglobales bacterium]
MSLGLYLSVPFCRTKCSYCNFASDVFSRAIFQRYVERVCSDIENAGETFAQMGAKFEPTLDSVYLGGGTPTLLDVAGLERLFVTISQNLFVRSAAEITVECAPGTLSDAMVECFVRCGVNRISLGVQSFVDREAATVGRLHTRAKVLEDISRLRAAGISNLNLDLIAGLPHQEAASWDFSLNEAIASGVPHVSIYMLEVDEDSRLGRELIAGGTRYHAHAVPDDELTADLYLAACEGLQKAAIEQYEISNFARPGQESSHNLKYWTRQPYLGFGVDAHSMLPAADPELDAFRFATPETLEEYVAGAAPRKTEVSRRSALEETFFLGLRLNRGVNLAEVEEKFGEEAVAAVSPVITELLDAGLLGRTDDSIRLTSRGRLLSNEVFERFIFSDLGEQSCALPAV